MKAIDLTGKRFGELTVVRFIECRQTSRGSRRFYLCKCDCGNRVEVISGNLLSGNSESCGCRKFDSYSGNATHGYTGTPEYVAWKSMRSRCLSKRCREYKHYGARGIKICKRWDRFENFLADMGPRPGDGYSLERKNCNRNYQPSNCVWIHRTKQPRNRRDTIRVTFRGETKPLVEWAEHFGLNYVMVKERYYRGWTVERMLTQRSRYDRYTLSSS